MLKKLRGNAGFTLLEVLAVVALLGVLGAMLLPSLDSAAGRAKNARLESDLATIDNAILLYKMDNGTCPSALTILLYKMDNGTCPSALNDLVDEYIAKGKKFEDATGTELVYTPSGDKLTYTLKGKNADGESVTSDGSSDAEE